MNESEPRAMRASSLLSAACALGSLALAAFACDGDGGTGGTGGGGMTTTSTTSGSPADRCAQITASITEAGFAAKVKVTCDGQYAYLGSDTYPDHDKMNGITGTNEQVPVPAPDYVSPIPLAPAPGDGMITIDAALGVAVNGVPIYDYSSQGTLDPNEYDPKADTKLQGQLDKCNGHAGRGDDYHYHAAPVCMIAAMANKGPAAILGWAFDGYPIYGDQNPDGTDIAAGDLDVCNGRDDPEFGHRYHTSAAPPYIVQCLTGQVDEALLPRVPPLDVPGGGGKPPGKPPGGGVQGLTFTEAADGSREMTYSYQGQGYYIRYQPAASQGCWDFEQRTVTGGGAVEKATYCRAP